MLAKAASDKRDETHSLPFTGHKLWQVTRGQWQELIAGTCGHSIQLFKEGSDGRQRTLVLAKELSVTPAMKEMEQRKDK